MAVQSRDRHGLAEPEAVELVDLVGPGRVVNLVRDQEHGAVGAAQQLRDLFIAGRHAGLRVDDEQHEIGLVDRRAGLGGDLTRDLGAVSEVDAARVDQDEAPPAPLADDVLAVAGHARLFMDDRRASGREPVHESRFSNVGKADDRRRPGELAHAGGTAWRGRPSAWTSTRKRQSSWMRRWISMDASR